MGLILNIDTANDEAGICLAADEHILGIGGNAQQKDHAAWLQPAIRRLMENTGQALSRLDAVAVTAGPGSYTGLRVGMASAKGICYALNIPLILVDTLKVMALACIQQPGDEEDYYVCPMIDARRQEVYSALYSKDLQVILPPAARILEGSGFDRWMDSLPVYFLGSGTAKWRQMTSHPGARFVDLPFLATHLALLAHESYVQKEFADIHLSEPVYLKEFHTHIKK